MADDTEKGPPTEYRVFRRVETHDEDGKRIDLGKLEIGEGEKLFLLSPDTFTGNVKKAAHAQYGDGDYAKAAARSFEEFPAKAKSVVSFK